MKPGRDRREGARGGRRSGNRGQSAKAPKTPRASTPHGSWWARLRRRLTALRRRVLLVWALVVLALAGAMVFLFYFSAAFTVQNVTASGARDGVLESAIERAQIPHGLPMARVSQGEVSRRVLEDLRVAQVDLERDWPSDVRLVLQEREPAVALRGAGVSWLADGSGVVFEQVDEPGDDLPLIALRSDPTELDRETVIGLAELWQTRPEDDELGGELVAPNVDRDSSIEMEVGVITLLWGPPTENEKKWNVVAALIAQETIDPEGALEMTIDVRIPDAPVVTGLPESTG